MAKAKQAEEKQPQAAPANLPADVKGTAVATTDMMSMLEGDAGKRGDVRAEDQAIPYLAILQKGSPEADPAHGDYIEGAVVGSFIDSVTKRMWSGKTGVLLLPVHYTRDYVEWVTRENGGGFVMAHGRERGPALLASCKKDDKRRDILPNGNQLVATAQHAVFLLDEESDFRPVPMMCAMTSTQLKKSRRWNTMIDNVAVYRADGSTFTPPSWLTAYRFITVPESNKAGTWFGYDFSAERVLLPVKSTLGDLPALPNGEAIYKAAKKFFDDMNAGAVKVAAPAGGSAEAGASEDGADPEDPPF